MKVADGVDDIPFGITSNADIYKEHEMEKDGVMLFKKVTSMLIFVLSGYKCGYNYNCFITFHIDFCKRPSSATRGAG